MTSTDLRRSFLDFFKSKQHTIVPSSSLLPDAPNLLFANSGMNQFVPFFLGTAPCSFSPARAADTQKCIRAGGKHNDLEDVGLDTYHHTFFEMLGNWSFGDYFKKEAIDWAWELLVDHWKFPPQRLYATVYQPSEGDPASFDQEAHDLWATHFKKAGLDPAVHIVPGNRKDNFWMMGETGPCGPCSELHMDLTPYGGTKGLLVNKGTAECIEIWNLVFMQFNANVDGSFSPLPKCHVDTGMGLERICSIIQGTRGFQEFGNVVISNYETDLFTPIFAALEKMSSHRYGSTLPQRDTQGALVPMNEQEKIDVAFRVIADHLRTLGFAIADGIEPGNNERHYVLRRILRRAVRYGRTLGFQQPFLYQLTSVLVEVMGKAFPELQEKESQIRNVLQREEEAFHKTLDKGLALFESEANKGKEISGAAAFRLYDEQGFPLDLTELLARERGLTVDHDGFEKLMKEQRDRARAAQKKEVISVSSMETTEPTDFLGFDETSCTVIVREVLSLKNKQALIFNQTVCYGEMGGQAGDTGTLTIGEKKYQIIDTQKSEGVWLHFIEGDLAPLPGEQALLSIDKERRKAIERHHTVTHLLHRALHKVIGPEVVQKGSSVTAEKLTFDFNSAALTQAQLEEIELLVNQELLRNAPVTWAEFPYETIKQRPEIMQFFGEKYGETVRVVQIGGTPGQLDGFSMELCGGTHVRGTGEIGHFTILSEGAVGAGLRRIEAVAGFEAHAEAQKEKKLIHKLAKKLQAPVLDVEKKLDLLLTKAASLEKEVHAMQQQIASSIAADLLKKSTTIGSTPAIIEIIPEADGNKLQAIANALKGKQEGLLLLAGITNGSVSLMATVSNDFKNQLHAGKLIQTIAPLIEGKGGGSADAARGGGRNVEGLTTALAEAQQLVVQKDKCL